MRGGDDTLELRQNGLFGTVVDRFSLFFSRIDQSSKAR